MSGLFSFRRPAHHAGEIGFRRILGSSALSIARLAAITASSLLSGLCSGRGLD
jgi:hypothetical protein